MNYQEILSIKYPNADWSITDPEDYSTLVWNDTELPKPTQEWCDHKIQKRISAHNNGAQINRRGTYPNLADQLDMLWHGMNDDESKRIEPFYSAIKAIKDQFPTVKE